MNYDEVLAYIQDLLARSDLAAQFAGLAEGTNANTIKTVNSITTRINGTAVTKAGTDNIAMTACAQQAISTYCMYLVSMDSAGAVTITKGTESASNTYVLPNVPKRQKAIAAFQVATNASATFTSGSVDLSAAGLTVAFYDFDAGPLTQWIHMTMKKLERKYNLRHMKVHTTAAVAVSTHTINNPVTGYKQFISAKLKDTNGYYYPLKRCSYAFALEQHNNLTLDIGTPELIAEVPSAETALTPDISPTPQLFLRPTTTAADTYTLDLLAYQYTPEFGIYTTNWYTLNAPDFLIYGALIEGEPYLYNDMRMPMWKQIFEERLKELVDSEIEEELSGSENYVESDYVV